MVYAGQVGNAKQGAVTRQTNQSLRPQYEALMGQVRASGARTVVLNWHIRYTGMPNGWTGRGLNDGFIRAARQAARAEELNLVVVYTIHEYTSLERALVEPSGLVSLNPEIGARLAADFRGLTVRNSRVPSLMTCFHTTSVDLIMQFVGDIDDERSDVATACLMQQLRLVNRPPTAVQAAEGILIFGMITPRHGLSAAVVNRLCDELDRHPALANVSVIIAGKPDHDGLVAELRNLAARRRRVIYHGLLRSFDDVAGVRYGISFDQHGFRHNASAQVNMIRAGHILFSRNGAETDAQLITRAVNYIEQCEHNSRTRLDVMTGQRSIARSSAPNDVGRGLDEFFRSLS